MKVQACPISFNGQTYDSLKEFAMQNNLNYSRVLAYHRKGKSPEEIVSLCQFSAASKEESEPVEGAKRFIVEYKGVKYPSLYAAASALGLSPGRLYDIRRRKNLSPKAVIEYAMENLTKAGTGTSPNSAPCVVEGVSYPSREAAIQAYNIPRITVYSRMEREGISFEESLVRGRNSSVYRPPVEYKFFNFRLVPLKEAEDTNQPVIGELARSLEYYRYKVILMQDLLSQQEVLFVNECAYIFYNKDARGIEIVSELPVAAWDNDFINLLNSTFVIAKIFTHPMTQKFYLSTFQSAKDEGQEIKSLLNTWFSFSSMRDKLLRIFELCKGKGSDNHRSEEPDEPSVAAIAAIHAGTG